MLVFGGDVHRGGHGGIDPARTSLVRLLEEHACVELDVVHDRAAGGQELGRQQGSLPNLAVARGDRRGQFVLAPGTVPLREARMAPFAAERTSTRPVCELLPGMPTAMSGLPSPFQSPTGAIALPKRPSVPESVQSEISLPVRPEKKRTRPRTPPTVPKVGSLTAMST